MRVGHGVKTETIKTSITFIDRRKPGWLISHTYIIPYISIECNLKDMNTNLVKAVNTCGSRACIKYRNLSLKSKVRVIITYNTNKVFSQ